MKVIVKTKYVFEGKEFESLKDIKNEIHNILGEEVIDQINKKIEIRHKDLFILLDILCSPNIRTVLTKFLNVEFTRDETEYEEGETINILDLK